MTTGPSIGDADLLTYSQTLVASLQAPSGAYPASPTFSAYRGYCWFRDGAFIADGMSAAGQADSADQFHTWCARAIEANASTVHAAVAAAHAGTQLPASQMLPTRFTFEGELGEGDR